jgi:hypothetical protein
MSAAILPVSPGADLLRRKRFTRSEVDRMLEIGILDGQRCELIDGELIDKMGQNPPHAYMPFEDSLPGSSGFLGRTGCRYSRPSR